MAMAVGGAQSVSISAMQILLSDITGRYLRQLHYVSVWMSIVELSPPPRGASAFLTLNK
jgi:hypothetical protein